jgi:hypothetical protein
MNANSWSQLKLGCEIDVAINFYGGHVNASTYRLQPGRFLNLFHVTTEFAR